MVLIACLLVMLSSVAHAQTPPDPAAMLTDEAPLHVRIKGQDYGLNSFILRRPGTDRLPVALLPDGVPPPAP